MQRIAASLTLLVFLALPCPALVSTNVPLDHWSYRAAEKLADYGFIDSAMLTVKPVSRVEMARHVAQAMFRLGQEDNPPEVLLSVLDRLKQEFNAELILLGVLDGWYGDSFIKPVEDPYVKYVHADNRPDLENLRGDEFRRGSNYRAGFASRIKLSEWAAFYLHPEYAEPSLESDSGIDLIEGYGKVMLGQLEVQVGRDSLWWGPGHHGSLVMSNNAQPLTMVKITNPQPVPLPWIFRALGPVKTAWFLTELEEDRDIPKARLSGIRFNVKPHPLLEMGLSRVIMFGGEGAPRVGCLDYVEMFLAPREQAENNQLAGFDGSLLLPLPRDMPLRSLRLYGDGAGEDEAGGLPSKWGYLVGLQMNDLFRKGRTDVRLEYAETHPLFYVHSLYTSGYTYEGRVIGHHAGTDSRDVFVQLSHYLTNNMIVDVAWDRQTHRLSSDSRRERDILECDLTFFASPDWRIKTGYRFENADGDPDDNHIFQFQLIREF